MQTHLVCTEDVTDKTKVHSADNTEKVCRNRNRYVDSTNEPELNAEI